jgi:hypothetical protein
MTQERIKISDRPVKLIEETAAGRVKVIAEGITYDEALMCLQVMYNAGHDVGPYDIQNADTGRLMSWQVSAPRTAHHRVILGEEQ